MSSVSVAAKKLSILLQQNGNMAHQPDPFTANILNTWLETHLPVSFHSDHIFPPIFLLLFYSFGLMNIYFCSNIVIYSFFRFSFFSFDLVDSQYTIQPIFDVIIKRKTNRIYYTIRGIRTFIIKYNTSLFLWI